VDLVGVRVALAYANPSYLIDDPDFVKFRKTFPAAAHEADHVAQPRPVTPHRFAGPRTETGV
jgi:hypothetical protein